MMTNLGNALIWGLFVTEFTILISIAPKRFHYLITHWLELFIIILPMLALTRFLLIAKYLKVSKTSYFLLFVKIQDILNIYRARSVLHRIIRILIIINIVKRLYQRRNSKKYLFCVKFHAKVAGNFCVSRRPAKLNTVFARKNFCVKCHFTKEIG
ncbi:MAG: hypothetical protein DRR16_11310 [Candidatus Parabeggiatoa sp. nov. 3]|nr:MAG: hypothetical protein DRQ99_17415 [Gammaproteobacteria bacterium]RKZ85752.1 MAG: hypothetical protein DRR16_11310 [Gammaproteobacteria bacterium]